jgi:LacI family transcriptional regulator
VYCDKVIIDDKAAAYEAVQSLIDKGRRKLHSVLRYASVGKLRTDGYTKALLDNNDFDENLIIKIEDVDNCEIIIAQLLEDKAIDAVFAVNELFAVTWIKTAKQN